MKASLKACCCGQKPCSGLENIDYWAGYQRGLRRAFHGERFGTDAEHQLWLSLSDDRAELGRGYRDGLTAGGMMEVQA